ncbi:type II toxin-antitoxin system PemK/MazF family toxin [uncultured Desulfovibrio sp.]|uniref:type II toxin-antitoxin system PemK/MazF family toxin n=2 Tax=uncultured Desulfovibrio sp. TaxID=167968 RepID=UPI0034283515
MLSHVQSPTSYALLPQGRWTGRGIEKNIFLGGVGMAIKFTPDVGTILLCDFGNVIEPEMCKKRPVVVLSSVSPWLCIVVPLSTTDPEEQMPWHCLVNTPKTLPYPYDSKVHWLKHVSSPQFLRIALTPATTSPILRLSAPTIIGVA